VLTTQFVVRVSLIPYAATQVQLDNSAIAIDNHYSGLTLSVSLGGGKWESAIITGYQVPAAIGVARGVARGVAVGALCHHGLSGARKSNACT